MASWEDLVRQKVGVPIQQGANKAANLTEEQILAMKHQALRGLSGMMPDARPNNEMDLNQVSAPDMSQADQQSRMGASIQAPQAMEIAAAKLRQEGAQRDAGNQTLNALEDSPMKGYSSYPAPAPAMRQFPNIQKKIEARQPVTKQDIHAMQAKEMTPDLESEMFPKEKEEEEK